MARAAVDSLHPLSHAFVTACAELGFAEQLDKNAPGAPGCGRLPRNVVDGIRVDAASAYISPNRNRVNLTIESGVAGRRIVTAADGPSESRSSDPARSIRSTGDQIVLCAGAVMSPHLLLLSGIGPAAQLRRHGIEVVADLPGVGSRCSDHPQLFLGFEALVTCRDEAGRPGRRGRPRHGGRRCAHHGDAVPRAHGRAGPRLGRFGDRVGDGGAAASCAQRRRVLAGVGRPGQATDDRLPLCSSRPKPDRTVAKCCRIGMAILDSAAMRGFGAGTHRHAPPRRSRRWITDNITTAVHLCSSAPMGPDSDPTAVVDQYCRVRGVEGLRVVDTSVLPTAPSRLAPPPPPCLIGERASAFFGGAGVVIAFSLADHLIAAVAAAGAGAVNAIAGGGTLISFPTLVALGAGRVSANVTNTVALCPGYFGGAVAQRSQLPGQRSRLVRLVDRRRFRRPHRIGAAARHRRGRVHQAGPVAHPAGLRAVGRSELHPQVAAHRHPHAWCTELDRGRIAPSSCRSTAAYFGAGLGIALLAVLGLVIDEYAAAGRTR